MTLIARLAALAALLAPPAALAEPDPADWDAVLAEARGQTVYWNAWGGATATNAFIRWAGDTVEARFGVTVEHVKLSDTGDAVSRVLAEKTAGKDTGGAIDLIWINGANFAAMKEAGLLFGPWAEELPNWRYVDVAGKPAVTSDFTVPTEGLEAPWAMAQVVFYHDTARLPDPPRTMAALLDWARAHPGRFTFPQPPDFLGSTFLKQALYGVVDDPDLLQQPVEMADYAAVTAPLWVFLDELTPQLWRSGRAYPQTGPRQIQLMADGEIDLAISFSPGEASTAIANGQLPDTVRTYVLEGGTIGNASFVAIPYNATAKAGAMVLADFLLSPEAQARAQDPDVLGYGTVLAMDKLSEADRARFAALDLGIATLSPEDLGPALPEPHPSWMTRLQDDWIARYGVAD
ncbi:ABC transporter substrate-binding protein [Rhodovulum adriaticum]|uniref:Putative thiamine transport system substrate-binding protein n=1 Tax=Rhodovulum adriaticum TaxID=35804 RepID=A0A4R2NIM6_RHOAD|nr:ABC transporter substrate-binding protein [Rhodovulum adriaticum]MBK1634611.1 ABC transporter substrate-binding protein [Rhodovulum adriaticum]TCP21240.1 putative thiamine transport system substrate-binding protein [Rhodovulum adriaticum]